MYFTRKKLTKTIMFIGTLVLCLTTIGVILNGIQQFKLGTQLANISQESNLAHVLVKQQAHLFSLMLLKNSPNDELVESLNNFANEEFVIDANLYASTGELLAQSKGSLSVKERLNQTNTQQIVEPVFAKQTLVGFLRVTFDATYEQNIQNKVNKLFQQLYAELIILVLTGALIATSCSYYFRRKVVHTRAIKKVTNFSPKTQAQRFHSKRRNFKSK